MTGKRKPGARKNAAPVAPLEKRPDDWRPAFVGQRPPFEPGNLMAVRHGARSPRVVSALALRLLDEFRERYPSLAEQYPDVVADFLESRSRIELLRQHLEDVGLTDHKGRLNDSALRHLRWAELHALKLAESLGLTPASDARLRRDQAQAAALVVDIAAVQANGAQFVPSFTDDDETEPAANVEVSDDAG